MNKKKKEEIKFFFYKTVIILITSIAFVNFSFNFSFNFFKKNILETFSHENKKKIFLIIKEDFFNLLQNEKAFSDKEIEKIKEFIKKFN